MIGFPVYLYLFVFLLQGATTPQERQLQEAIVLLRSGKIAPAAQKLQALLAAQPQNANAINLMGIIRGEQRQFSEAEKLFKQALKFNPKLAGAAVNLGYLYRRTQRPEDALVAFLQADKIQPGDPEIRYNIASLRADAGELAGALALLERIPAKDRPPGYAVVLARCLLGLGRIGDLQRSLPDLRSLLSNHPEVIAEFVQFLLGARLADDAIVLLEGIQGNAAGSFPVAFNLGEAYQLKGEPGKAARHYRDALNLEPGSVETLKRLSSIAQKEGNWEEMFHYLSRARGLAPNSASILHGYALASFRTGKVAEAQFAIHQALSLEPENPDFLYLYGITLLHFSDLPNSVETFRKLIRLKPDDPVGYLALATSLYESARYDEALVALHKCRELDADTVEVTYYLGMIAHYQGESQKALDHLDSVLSKDPNHAAARAGRGGVYARLGKFESAKVDLEHSVKLRPEHSGTHYQLSQVLVRLNEPERAQEELKLYRELKVKEEEARDAASRLVPASPKP